MRYESDPKHSDPWQRGRRGARCPSDIDATQAQPEDLRLRCKLLHVASANGDCGLLLRMAPRGGAARAPVHVPLAPGWFGTVRVADVQRIPFNQPAQIHGPGVLALDGDREHKLPADGAATIHIRRDGPRVVQISAALRYAAREGLLASATAPAPK